MLAEAAGPAVDAARARDAATIIRSPGWSTAGSHPDFRLLERLENAKTGELARNISVDQVRALGDLFDLTPALSPWRAVVIDSADDLEASAANALLKMLEEPPANTPLLPRQPCARAACCRRSARAAAGSISSRSTMTP